MELRRYWEVFWRRKGLFALIVCGIVAPTLILAFFATPVYKASTRLLVRSQDVNSIIIGTVPSAPGKFDTISNSNALGTLKLMLEDKGTVTRLINEFKLQKQKDVPFSAVEIMDAGLMNLLTKKTALTVKRVTDTEVFEISAFSADPALAVKMSESLTSHLLELREKLNREDIGKVIDLLTREVARLKGMIDDSEAIIRNYKVDNKALNIDEKATSYTSQLLTTELTLAKLAVEKREEHPDIRAALEQIAFIKKELQDIPRKQNEVANMQRVNTFLVNVYTSLSGDLEKAKILKAMSITNFLVIEKAHIPDQDKKHYKYFPKKKNMLVLALIISGFFGVTAVYFTEYIDDTIKSPRELKAWTGQKVLATVPRLKDTEIFPPKESTPILEAVSDLWLSIRINAKPQGSGEYPRVVSVTSYGEKEGKSLVAATLGLVLSKAGYKTLLVDFDLRNPLLSKLYASSEKGLADFIANATEAKNIDPQLFTLLSANFYFLPTVPISRPDMVRIANSPQLPTFIEKARKEFDIIIVDTASLNNSREPFFMAKESDTTVLVVEAGRFQVENVRWAIDELKETGVIIAGVVLNKACCQSRT